jgi:hypothetical protein
MDEPAFIEASILPSTDGAAWRDRWFTVKSSLAEEPRVLTAALGAGPKGANEFERCNRWLLNTALAYGPEKLRFIGLWNGAGGDGPGGTRHMMNEARRRTGRVDWIDTRKLA